MNEPPCSLNVVSVNDVFVNNVSVNNVSVNYVSVNNASVNDVSVKRVSVNQMSANRAAGEIGAKRPLVWLHGFMGTGLEFESLAASLIESHRSYLVDLPGHGGSPLAEPVSYAAWAAMLVRLLDANGLEKTDLVGYSMGGRLALYFALVHPNRVRRVVLESTSPGIRGTQERVARAQLDSARSKMLVSGELSVFLEGWYRSRVFSNLRRDPKLFARIVESRSKNDKLALAYVLTAMSPGKQESLWRMLPSLAVPVLMIAGSNDGKYVRVTQKAAGVAKNIRSRTISGAGHNVHLERPRTYLQAVRRFLQT